MKSKLTAKLSSILTAATLVLSTLVAPSALARNGTPIVVPLQGGSASASFANFSGHLFLNVQVPYRTPGAGLIIYGSQPGTDLLEYLELPPIPQGTYSFKTTGVEGSGGMIIGLIYSYMDSTNTVQLGYFLLYPSKYQSFGPLGPLYTGDYILDTNLASLYAAGKLNNDGDAIGAGAHNFNLLVIMQDVGSFTEGTAEASFYHIDLDNRPVTLDLIDKFVGGQPYTQQFGK